MTRPPVDFRQQCAGLLEIDTPGRAVRALADNALDQTQLEKLARLIGTLRESGQDLGPLLPLRLGIIGTGTLNFIEPALVATAARYGFVLECIRGDYDQVAQEAFDPQSIINRAAPDAVLIAVDYRALPLKECPEDAEEARQRTEAAVEQLHAIRDAIQKHSGATPILQTLAPPPEPLLGSFDCVQPGTLRFLIAEVNRALCLDAAENGGVLFDVAALADLVGSAEWHSPAQWNLAKLPFDAKFLPLYADHIMRVLAAMRGKSRRCLVLDLDNTLWGGVIGDDGLDGIRIAQGDYVGEAHLAVQHMALALRNRGVVLAVSSKNEDAVARLPFRHHPEMLLREEHFAVFQANWRDKATNIAAIAEELSLGIDAMVFLDDNPAERLQVRQALPEVAVPELPDDPALFARALGAAGYFEAIAFSEEDRARAAFYEGNSRRVALRSQVGDLDAYLRSLEMEITFQPFDEVGRARITQLINKSNQFNLTTRRYTEAQVAKAQHDADCFTLQVRLVDAVGDNGMISVVICRRTSSDTWEIDTWLMSCRVLGRKVEQMVLRELVHHAADHAVTRLVGRYIPTERNAMVRDHYPKLGFSLIAEKRDGATAWELRLPAEIAGAPMAVRRLDFREPIALRPCG
ncbi:MAG TPA: HAD-IIIC family phosphatase [Aliidongia sp.]|nr:HAD-IIIC family phosphatase [Aliidongia sp.]